MKPQDGNWHHVNDIGHKSYICGYCGETTGIRVGYRDDTNGHAIYICGGSNRPTYFEYREIQTPSPILGNPVRHLPSEIESLYQESRYCTQVKAYTACVLVCRKILMHIGVEKGADENKSFIYYVEFLVNENYVPPDGKGWVDHIRTKGNEANHDIVIMSKEEAFELLSFVELLLKFVYEFPARIKPASGDEQKA